MLEWCREDSGSVEAGEGGSRLEFYSFFLFSFFFDYAVVFFCGVDFF